MGSDNLDQPLDDTPSSGVDPRLTPDEVAEKIRSASIFDQAAAWEILYAAVVQQSPVTINLTEVQQILLLGIKRTGIQNEMTSLLNSLKK